MDDAGILGKEGGCKQGRSVQGWKYRWLPPCFLDRARAHSWNFAVLMALLFLFLENEPVWQHLISGRRSSSFSTATCLFSLAFGRVWRVNPRGGWQNLGARRKATERAWGMRSVKTVMLVGYNLGNSDAIIPSLWSIYTLHICGVGITSMLVSHPRTPLGWIIFGLHGSVSTLNMDSPAMPGN